MDHETPKAADGVCEQCKESGLVAPVEGRKLCREHYEADAARRYGFGDVRRKFPPS
jgi:hypothetical protein